MGVEGAASGRVPSLGKRNGEPQAGHRPVRPGRAPGALSLLPQSQTRIGTSLTAVDSWEDCLIEKLPCLPALESSQVGQTRMSAPRPIGASQP